MAEDGEARDRRPHARAAPAPQTDRHQEREQGEHEARDLALVISAVQPHHDRLGLVGAREVERDAHRANRKMTLQNKRSRHAQAVAERPSDDEQDDARDREIELRGMTARRPNSRLANESGET